MDMRQVADGVYATSRAAMLAEVADVVVFDMDGVLIDVHRSYPVVICEAVSAYLREQGFTGDGLAVTPEETALFKAAGGFNSDWALAQGLALIFLVKESMDGIRHIDGLRSLAPDLATVARACGQYGGGLIGLFRALSNWIDEEELDRVKAHWDIDRITRLAQEFYAGDESPDVFGFTNETFIGRGLMREEEPLVNREKLLAAPFRYGLYTGRNMGEAQIAVKSAGFAGVFQTEAMVTSDKGVQKPNPQGLAMVAQSVQPRLMIYVGDNLDDWQTAARYEAERPLDAPPCLFCGMLGGSPGPLAFSLFEERGADLIAQSVNQLIDWLSVRHVNHGSV
ncbi:MAG: HAD family hydrolase [Firmicutes bacterium]|nr:HAD family hydrolase [Bacillota bacterium]